METSLLQINVKLIDRISIELNKIHVTNITTNIQDNCWQKFLFTVGDRHDDVLLLN